MFPHIDRRFAVRLLLTAAAAAGLLLATGCASNTTGSTHSTTAAAAPTSPAPAGGAAPGPQAPQPASVIVTVKDMKFSPDNITVKPGTVVGWNFSDKVPHAVQGIGDEAMGINSPISTDGQWSHTFAVPGTYRYLCPLHPEMRGTVTVK
ncbi:MAG: cupredoxin domain-containing protein [Nocardia sp.]|nr:cupredoxin domain-containing protein [Nocardia sp.]